MLWADIREWICRYYAGYSYPRKSMLTKIIVKDFHTRISRLFLHPPMLVPSMLCLHIGDCF